jgi:hypothetical protein
VAVGQFVQELEQGPVLDGCLPQAIEIVPVLPSVPTALVVEHQGSLDRPTDRVVGLRHLFEQAREDFDVLTSLCGTQFCAGRQQLLSQSASWIELSCDVLDGLASYATTQR